MDRLARAFSPSARAAERQKTDVKTELVNALTQHGGRQDVEKRRAAALMAETLDGIVRGHGEEFCKMLDGLSSGCQAATAALPLLAAETTLFLVENNGATLLRQLEHSGEVKELVLSLSPGFPKASEKLRRAKKDVDAHGHASREMWELETRAFRALPQPVLEAFIVRNPREFMGLFHYPNLAAFAMLCGLNSAVRNEFIAAHCLDVFKNLAKFFSENEESDGRASNAGIGDFFDLTTEWVSALSPEAKDGIFEFCMDTSYKGKDSRDAFCAVAYTLACGLGKMEEFFAPLEGSEGHGVLAGVFGAMAAKMSKLLLLSVPQNVVMVTNFLLSFFAHKGRRAYAVAINSEAFSFRSLFEADCNGKVSPEFCHHAVGILQSADEETRIAFMGRMGDAFIKNLMGSSFQEVSQCAIEILSRATPGERSKFILERGGQFIETLLRSESDSVRRSGFSLLNGISEEFIFKHAGHSFREGGSDNFIFGVLCSPVEDVRNSGFALLEMFSKSRRMQFLSMYAGDFLVLLTLQSSAGFSTIGSAWRFIRCLPEDFLSECFQLRPRELFMCYYVSPLEYIRNFAIEIFHRCPDEARGEALSEGFLSLFCPEGMDSSADILRKGNFSLLLDEILSSPSEVQNGLVDKLPLLMLLDAGWTDGIRFYEASREREEPEERSGVSGLFATIFESFGRGMAALFYDLVHDSEARMKLLSLLARCAPDVRLHVLSSFHDELLSSAGDGEPNGAPTTYISLLEARIEAGRAQKPDATLQINDGEAQLWNGRIVRDAPSELKNFFLIPLPLSTK